MAYAAVGAAMISEANKSHASGSTTISVGLRKGAHRLQPYPETCRALGPLQPCSSSRRTSCLSGSSIQNPWQEAVPINIFAIGRVLLSPEISRS